LPELPEVEYARRQLQRAMAGARIVRALTRRPNLRLPFPADFAARLEGQQVRGVARRAKYLLVELASGDVLLMHLGMSGSFRMLRSRREPARGPGYGDATAPTRARRMAPTSDRGIAPTNDSRVAPTTDGHVGFEPHDHVVFEMSNGAVIVFNDPRRFGFMTLLAPGQMESHAALARLGPEPLARRFDVAALAADLRRRKTSLKIALLDQRIVAGLGNIYVSEALHRAGLSPKRKASTLVARSGEPHPALQDLVDAIRQVLKQAIRNQHRTGNDDPFLVYDREGQRCPRRGCGGTIRRIVQGGRSTFFCPVCQR
jgi:formamidopyrimidine-DNA glycosylase